MKRKGLLLVVFVVLAFGCVGCGSTFKTEESAIYVKDNGHVIEASIEAFDKEIYKEDELETFVKESIDHFNKENGDGAVKMADLEVKDKKAKLYLEFKSGEDYAKFDGKDFFSGTVAEAIAEGYSFDETYFKVDGKKLGKEVTDNDMLEEELNVVILKERVGVKVDGTVCYVSDNVKVQAEDMVLPVKNDEGKIKENFGDDYIVVVYK